MNSREIRKKFLDFFREKAHKIVPSSSLIPEDQSVLFTTAGMQQFSLYLAAKKDVLKDFGTRHLASCQKCVRTGDIESIGDDTHHVFFEMLGNWSIGEDEKGYFKEGAIKYALEFLLDRLNLDKNRLWITIFKGEKDIPKDKESFDFCRKKGFPEERILEFGMEDNFWGPPAKTGPCGPCLEIFYDRGEEYGCKSKDCGPNCPRCKRFVELWTLVFMEYLKDQEGKYILLNQRNVDTGMGLERLTAILNNKPSAYETDLFLPIISKIENLSGKKYQENKKIFRILADHIRASVFIASEGVLPSNVERGYILRRLLRRMIRFGRMQGLRSGFLIDLGKVVIENYRDIYPELQSHQADILTVFQNEEEKFARTLERGLKETNAILEKGDIEGKDAFRIYETYGFPLEMIEEIAKEKGRKIKNKESFQEAFKKHQEISRAGAEKKFGGIGKEATYEATKLHTATHLLHQALREVLGKHVRQMGSDITPQRLRFDFSHPKKLTPQEIKKVEDIVNQKIKEDLEVKREEMSYEQAIKSGALAFFKEKYPPRVSVYSIGNFSKEICAGPHVKRTSELGHFKIIKEESSGAGVRRIRAILE
ncbi:alanine--tRNA ligase [bacterium]|nr:alanine--tRNA ligase [bacterium]